MQQLTFTKSSLVLHNYFCEWGCGCTFDSHPEDRDFAPSRKL
jgi:hypothetical protein